MALVRNMKREENRNHYEYGSGYFRIGNVRMENSKIKFSVYGYGDKIARDHFRPSTTPPIPMPMPSDQSGGIVFSKDYEVATTILPIPIANEGETIEDVVKKSIYSYLKTTNEFIMAVDDI